MMKKWFPLLAAGLMAFALATNADAAKRFGGGMSFGRPAPAQMAPANRGSGIQPAPAQRPQAAPQQQKAAPAGAAPAAAKPASPLRGMLMGAAAALGIAALAHYLGIGSELGTILLMALLFFAGLALLKVLFGRKQLRPAAQRASVQNASVLRQEPSVPERGPESDRSGAAYFQGNRAQAGSVLDEFSKGATQPLSSLPEGFDKTAFLDECKKNFARLQQAWSTGNVLQLSEFCTDEVFTVLTHQLRDRHGEKLDISVLSLNAELSGLTTEGDTYLAAVHFTGRVNVSCEVEEVNEIWSLERPVADQNQGWLLAGIQQVAES